MEADLLVLKEIPLLKTLTMDELKAMIPMLELETYRKDEIVFQEGKKGDALYLILTGKVKFIYRHDSGEIDVFEEIGPSKLFGEVGALSYDRIRTATAQATEDLTVYKLKRDDLVIFLKAHPEAAMHLLSSMADRLQRSGKQLQHSPVYKLIQTISHNLKLSDKTAKWVAQFAGSVPFLFLHAFVYTIWIIVGVWQGEKGFDPYPFHLLALVIGIEALVVSCFVLMNQFREDKAEGKRNDMVDRRNAHEYAVNVAAKEKLDELYTKLVVPNQLSEFPAEREMTVVINDRKQIP